MTDAELQAAYLDILAKADPALFDGSRKTDPAYAGLSGLFLTSAPPLWAEGKRVMVVGRETRGWKLIDEARPYAGPEDYVRRSVGRNAHDLSKGLAQPNGRGASFFNFLRDVGGAVGQENLAWANLFCFDWKHSMPTEKKTRLYEPIVDLSEDLLKTAIRVLKPETIIFANGGGSALVRRRYFSPDDPQVTSESRNFFAKDGILVEDLWAFSLAFEGRKIQCYRCHHPSGIRGGSAARKARAYLVAKLKQDLASPSAA